MVAVLTPHLVLHSGDGATTPAAAAVAAAQYSTQAPDQQCVDSGVFDSIAGTFEVSADALRPTPRVHRTSRFALADDLLESSGGPRPTSPAARALALPLQGHMTRLRI